MAAGDIVSCTINPTSWQSVLTIEGMGTGGNYNLGLGTFNSILSPNLPKVIFNYTSSGYDDLGNPIGISQTVYGTTGVRLNYPNDNIKDEVVNGGNVSLKISLSDFIYQKDSDITVNILSGLYSSGSLISSGVNNLPVTNNGELQYPKVVANWSWPNYDVITGSTFKLRCCAFHRSAREGRPVRVVKFTAQDTGGNAVTGWVTGATIDATVRDPVKIIEYVAELSSSNLIQGSTITGNFVAYPWCGDSGSLIDTSQSLNAYPTQYYAPTTLLNDKNQTYGVTIAVVNSITGQNHLGVALDSGSFNINNPPAAYSTIASAATGIRYYNNINRGRNDVGRGIIYLQSGTYPVLGQTISPQSLFGDDPKTYVTIAGFPGESRNNIQVTGGGGTPNIQEKMKFQNVFFTGSAGTIFGLTDYLWVDNCRMKVSHTTVMQSDIIQYYTHNLIEDFRLPGVNFNNNFSFRGNTYSNFYRNVYAHVFIGNLRTGTVTNSLQTFFNQVSGTVAKSTTNLIFAYNKILNYASESAGMSSFQEVPNESGLAIVQNLLEYNATLGGHIAEIAATASNVNPFKNYIVWHNTFVGARQSIAYISDGDGQGFDRGINFSYKNNVVDNVGTKTDNNIAPFDGGRTGNWSQVFGVGDNGNANAHIAFTVFNKTFPGINCIDPDEPEGTGYYQYVAPGVTAGVGGGTGHGNYSLQSGSPLVDLPISFILPYDIEGTRRTSSINAAGAYNNFGPSGDSPPTGEAPPEPPDPEITGGHFLLSDADTSAILTRFVAAVQGSSTPISYIPF